MTKKICNGKSLTQQKGLVLFFALIALVAMSLAGVALIRSVDNSVLVAGNLAFKQSAQMSADSAFPLTSNFLKVQSPGVLAADAPTLGYHATPNTLDYRLASTWTNANSALANGAGFDANGTDSSGNTVRYVIERMCRSAGSASPDNCMLGVAPGATGGLPCNPCAPGSTFSVIYRITSRVIGPKNTVSFVQAYVY